MKMTSTNYEELIISLRDFKDCVVEICSTSNDVCDAFRNIEIFEATDSLKADISNLCPKEVEERFSELIESFFLGEALDISDFENGIIEICDLIEKIQHRSISQTTEGIYNSESNNYSIRATWKSTDTSNLGISSKPTKSETPTEATEKDNLEELFEDENDDFTDVDELLKALEKALDGSEDDSNVSKTAKTNKKTIINTVFTPIEKHKEHLGQSVYSFLKRNNIETLEELSKLSIVQMMMFENMELSSIPTILYLLNDYGYRPSDCNVETYPDIEDFIKTHFVCKECKNALDGIRQHTQLCYCFSCGERHNRLCSHKPFEIEVKNSIKETYNGGETGITIYVNIKSNLHFPFKLKLQDCFLYTNQRQWTSSYNYTGYVFTEDYIMPNSTKTFGKIWVDDKWENKDLKTNEDYLTLSFNDLKTHKTHYFKFLYSGFNSWELNDYYELD